MKVLLALIVAVLAVVSTVPVRGDEIVEPVTFEIGQRVDGDMLLDLYYTESDASAGRGTHSVSINWEYSNINFIRIYAYAVSFS